MSEPGPSNPIPNSSQTLEDFISQQFTSLALDVPEDDVEYIARLVEEEDLPEEDKVEGVKGMIEGFLPPDDPPSSDTLDTSISHIISHYNNLKSAADDLAASRAAEQDKDEGGDGDYGDGDGQSDGSSSGEEEEGEVKGARAARKRLLASLTPEELAAAQKRALLRQYGYVEESDIPTSSDPDSASGPPRGLTLLARHEEKLKSDRRDLIERAIMLESKRRKRKNRQKEGVDLMAPNLNKEKVQVKGQMMREKAKVEANKVRDRDRLALEKQREGEKKKLEEKRKKAQKGERRA